LHFRGKGDRSASLTSKPSGKSEAESGTLPRNTRLAIWKPAPIVVIYLSICQIASLGGPAQKKVDFAPCAPSATLVGWLMAVLD
jgi:hypothetical protein